MVIHNPIKMLNVTGIPAGPMDEILNIVQEYTGRVDEPIDAHPQHQMVAGQDEDGSLTGEDYKEWRLVTRWINDNSNF